jgi:hypothetical protein
MKYIAIGVLALLELILLLSLPLIYDVIANFYPFTFTVGIGFCYSVVLGLVGLLTAVGVFGLFMEVIVWGDGNK